MNATGLHHVQWICESFVLARPKGLFCGGNPFNYAPTILLVQLIVSALVSAFLQFLLTPLGETAFTSMMLAGFVLGPTFWGDNNPVIEFLYPKKITYITQTLACLGCLIYMFVIGAKMDIGMVRRTGKKAVAIGILSFFIPLIINLTVAKIISSQMELESSIQTSLYVIAVLQSTSTFHVIICLLADLKLLNSELGRIASSSSMISGSCSGIMVLFIFTARQGAISTSDSILWMFVSAFFMLMFIFFILRPIMLWMIEQTSEGKPIKEGYIFSIFVMLLGCVFCSEIIGQHIMFGAIALGMAVPVGPPLGSALVTKLETFSFSILLPSYFVCSLSPVNVFSIESETVSVICIFAVTGSIAKVLGAMLPCLYFKMDPIDSFSLGLIMSTQGITDVLLLQQSFYLYLVDHQAYSIMVLTMVLLSGTFTPLIKTLYNPSKQYSSCNKRTIQHGNDNVEFRMLVCLYNQDSTPSMISILEVSNPTPNSPICCYVLHLMELAGRLSPLLVYHKPGKREDFHAHCSSHIINAFRSYEEHSNGNIVVNLFTAISPWETINEEVYRLALEKRTSLVILPFHKQWKLHSVEEFAHFRSVNRHILSKSPCSVGILVDRGTLGANASKNNFLYNIGMIFVHGKDDREALAYAIRMARHPNVGVTVIHMIDPSPTNMNSLEMELDNDAISEFRMAIVGRKHQFYREEVVKDSVEMVRAIRSLDNSYDLMLVGRYHDSQSPIFMGLTDWNEFPELGFIGDMLAASDSCCEISVLVVQQQKTGHEDRIGSIRYIMEDSSETVQILHGYDKD